MTAQELRRRAALCRRAANVPTSGSSNADRILLELAEQLEREADHRELQPHGADAGTRCKNGRTDQI
jgi:hypothetical protein